MNYIIKDGELYHWKYIKKVKRNGRWIYYYDPKKGSNGKTYNPVQDALGFDEKDKFNDADFEYRRREHQTKSAHDEYQDVESKLYNKYHGDAQLDKDGQPVLSERAQKDYAEERALYAKPAYQKYERIKASYEAAGKAAVKARDEYYKSPIGALDKAHSSVKEAVQRGAEWIDNFFKKKR